MGYGGKVGLTRLDKGLKWEGGRGDNTACSVAYGKACKRFVWGEMNKLFWTRWAQVEVFWGSELSHAI